MGPQRLHQWFEPMILLVTDQSPERKATTRILRQAGYDVIEASTGQEALKESRLQAHGGDTR